MFFFLKGLGGLICEYWFLFVYAFLTTPLGFDELQTRRSQFGLSEVMMSSLMFSLALRR